MNGCNDSFHYLEKACQAVTSLFRVVACALPCGVKRGQQSGHVESLIVFR